jgi:hypothetical protein
VDAVTGENPTLRTLAHHVIGAIDGRQDTRRAATMLAAVESEAMSPVAQTPHQFVGRLDRWCEVCNRPDRHPIHADAA